MVIKHTLSSDETDVKLGQQVHHQKFGSGIIIKIEGSGKGARVKINFEHTGSKWLVLAYAKLKII